MIVVLIGVAGSGKTTVGELLAARLGAPFLDADELHAPASVERMRRGEPLGDAARDAWFDRVLAAAAARDPLVLACSALRRSHRSRLRGVADVRMFLLDVPADELERRLRGRREHFFPARLLRSQLDALEAPLPEERIATVDAARPAALVAGEIIARLEPDPRG